MSFSLSFKFLPCLLSEPLVIDVSTTMEQVFETYTNEATFIFTCNASGTLLTLTWYKNGEQILVDGQTLIIAHPNPMDNGVYQCLWTSKVRPFQYFDSVSWAMMVWDRGGHHSMHTSIHVINLTDFLCVQSNP